MARGAKSLHDRSPMPVPGPRRRRHTLRRLYRCDGAWRMIRFSEDDRGYLAWIAAHPDGFVLNVRCPSDSRCVVLHRANCTSISNDTYELNAFTGRKHHKICATSEAELKLAAKSEGRLDGTFSKRCGLCGPWTPVESPIETARRPAAAATSGEKITEPIGLLSAKLGKQILRRPVVQPSVSARD